MVSSTRDESTTDGEDSSGDAPESDYKKLFSEGEKVLAYHGPSIYEAKVQKAEIRKKTWRYFVHYLGWNKNWDEWVGMDRLLKNTDENILKQQALDKKAGVEKNTKSGRWAQTKTKSSAVTKGRKRKADSGTEDNPALEKLIKVQIPPNLKKQLINDWEQVTQQNKLVKLPRSPCVDDILTKYIEFRLKKDGMPGFAKAIKYLHFLDNDDCAMGNAVGEIFHGIRSYFDKALPSVLLFKKERQQYKEAIQDNISPSNIYGAEHLLRLFVKLPEMLACMKIEEETLLLLQQKLLEFLKHLQNNESNFFVSSYDGPKAKGKDN